MFEAYNSKWSIWKFTEMEIKLQISWRINQQIDLKEYRSFDFEASAAIYVSNTESKTNDSFGLSSCWLNRAFNRWRYNRKDDTVQ